MFVSATKFKEDTITKDDIINYGKHIKDNYYHYNTFANTSDTLLLINNDVKYLLKSFMESNTTTVSFDKAKTIVRSFKTDPIIVAVEKILNGLEKYNNKENLKDFVRKIIYASCFSAVGNFYKGKKYKFDDFKNKTLQETVKKLYKTRKIARTGLQSVDHIANVFRRILFDLIDVEIKPVAVLFKPSLYSDDDIVLEFFNKLHRKALEIMPNILNKAYNDKGHAIYYVSSVITDLYRIMRYLRIVGDDINNSLEKSYQYTVALSEILYRHDDNTAIDTIVLDDGTMIPLFAELGYRSNADRESNIFIKYKVIYKYKDDVIKFIKRERLLKDIPEIIGSVEYTKTICSYEPSTQRLSVSDTLRVTIDRFLYHHNSLFSLMNINKIIHVFEYWLDKYINTKEDVIRFISNVFVDNNTHLSFSFNVKIKQPTLTHSIEKFDDIVNVLKKVIPQCRYCIDDLASLNEIFQLHESNKPHVRYLPDYNFIHNVFKDYSDKLDELFMNENDIACMWATLGNALLFRIIKYEKTEISKIITALLDNERFARYYYATHFGDTILLYNNRLNTRVGAVSSYIRSDALKIMVPLSLTMFMLFSDDLYGLENYLIYNFIVVNEKLYNKSDIIEWLVNTRFVNANTKYAKIVNNMVKETTLASLYRDGSFSFSSSIFVDTNGLLVSNKKKISIRNSKLHLLLLTLHKLYDAVNITAVDLDSKTVDIEACVNILFKNKELLTKMLSDIEDIEHSYAIDINFLLQNHDIKSLNFSSDVEYHYKPEFTDGYILKLYLYPFLKSKYLRLNTPLAFMLLNIVNVFDDIANNVVNITIDDIINDTSGRSASRIIYDKVIENHDVVGKCLSRMTKLSRMYEDQLVILSDDHISIVDIESSLKSLLDPEKKIIKKIISNTYYY